METRRERTRRWTIATALIVTSLVLLVAGLIVIHFLWTPLDVLWYRALRQFAPDFMGSIVVPFAVAGHRWSA